MHHISFAPDVQPFVNTQLHQGRHLNDLVSEGLRLLQDREMLRQAKLEALRAEIQKGLEGPFVPLDIEDIIERGHQRSGKVSSAS